MRDKFMEDLALFLDTMSNQVGQVINEYHWRELCSYRVELEKRFKFNLHELSDYKGREDTEGLHPVVAGPEIY